MSHHILIVDDTVDCSKALARLLGRYGFSVDIAYNGVEAIAAVEAVAPDLVILDLHMPVMDGYEFLNVARTLPQFNQCRVMVYTADYAADENRLRQLGVSRVCRKTYTSFQTLLGAVQASLGDGA